MSEFKVVEVFFKEESGDLQKAINAETKQGWNFVTLSTYSKNTDHASSTFSKKAHAVIVFSKG